jgi:hypothetical protein
VTASAVASSIPDSQFCGPVPDIAPNASMHHSAGRSPWPVLCAGTAFC